jgi:hypothetical protein
MNTPTNEREQTQASDAACPHEAWEVIGNARICADCRIYIGAEPAVQLHANANTAPHPVTAWDDPTNMATMCQQIGCLRLCPGTVEENIAMQQVNTAPVVDEAMVERALIAGWLVTRKATPKEAAKWREYFSDVEEDELPDFMRAALTAALNPGVGGT